MTTTSPAVVAAFSLGAAVGAALAWAHATRTRKGAPVHAYDPQALHPASLPAEPMAILKKWMQANEATQGVAARFMVLATSSPSEGATARTVLLQSITPEGGLVIGTTPSSLKGRQLADDPRAEVVMRWGQLQARIRGTMRKGTPDETAHAFAGLPLGAKLGLPLLSQGKPVDEAGYAAIAAAYAAKADAFESSPTKEAPPCPTGIYSAYVLEPRCVEFYSGGHPGYVNDRFLYVRTSGGAWERMRLQG